MRGERQYLTALRRGVALGLGLVAVWGVSLTADLSGLGGALASLGENPTLTASLLAGQLAPLSGEGPGLTGWGRLLLEQSALLDELLADLSLKTYFEQVELFRCALSLGLELGRL